MLVELSKEEIKSLVTALGTEDDEYGLTNEEIELLKRLKELEKC